LPIVFNCINRWKLNTACTTSLDKADEYHNEQWQIEKEQDPKHTWADQADQLQSFITPKEIQHGIRLIP
jgi:hypothetical protein